jgi:hypothetical protein
MPARDLALVSKLPDLHPHTHHFCEITSSSGKNIKRNDEGDYLERVS